MGAILQSFTPSASPSSACRHLLPAGEKGMGDGFLPCTMALLRTERRKGGKVPPNQYAFGKGKSVPPSLPPVCGEKVAG